MRIDFSFDDGHMSDIRAGNLLLKYGFTGTFYNTNGQQKGTFKMSPPEIAEHLILKGHEIGSHTITHPMDMKLCTDEQLAFELGNSKWGTEMVFRTSLAGKPITKFCYPRGRHDERVRKAVKEAGYSEARTTRVLHIRNFTDDPFQMPTTIHMFQREEYEGVHWDVLARSYFLKALEASKLDDTVFFHLWGHTKEMDAYNEWERFEEFLKFARERVG